VLTGSAPWAGRAWTDDGSTRDSRRLKHRAKRDTRPVPVAPELVQLIRAHLTEFGTTKDGRLAKGGDIRCPPAETFTWPLTPNTADQPLTPANETGPSVTLLRGEDRDIKVPY
jgi:hypothetical protein